jgi:NitT/TauT family transport system substrate-binding protein
VLRKLAIPFVVFLTLAACGGDNGSGSAATTAAPSTAGTVSTTATTAGAASTTSAAVPTTGAATSSTAPQKTETIRLATITATGVDQSALLVGREAGIFDTCGIKLETVPFNTPPDAIRAATTQAVDLVSIGSAPIITAFHSGEPLRIVSGDYFSSAHLSWVVTPDSPIKSVADLKGKKIGVSSPLAPTETAVRFVLTQEGLDPNKDVEIVPVGGLQQGLAAMAAGQVDTTYLGDPTLTTQLKENKVRVVISLDEYTPFQLGVFVGTKDWVQGHAQVIDRFLPCVQKAFDHVKADPIAAGKAFAKIANIPEDVGVEVIQYAVSKNAYSLDLSEAGMQFSIDQLKAAQVLPADYTLDNLKELLENSRS